MRRPARRTVRPALASLLIAITVAVVGIANANPADAAALDELARRLLGPWGDPAGMRTELVVGTVPADLPFALPLPAPVETVGSLVRRNPGGDLLNVQIVLDGHGSTEAIMTEFDRTFRAAGWTGRPEGSPVGFAPPQANLAAMYCAPDDGRFVFVNAFFVRGAPADVRVDVNLEGHWVPCPVTHEPPPYEHAPLPSLPAPDGSDVLLHGGTLLTDEASSFATLRTSHTAREVFRHYEALLESAGWTRTDVLELGQVRTSRWSRVAAERVFTGVLTLVELRTERDALSLSFVSVAEDDSATSAGQPHPHH